METLRGMIKRHEGWRLKPYLCSKNHMTIGAGHNLDVLSLDPIMTTYLKEHGTITNEMAEELLTADIEIALEGCHRLYHSFDYFTDGRKMALLDFVFNVGVGTAKQFYIANTCINLERWDEAAKEFVQSTWYNQTGKRSREIVAMILEEKVEAA